MGGPEPEFVSFGAPGSAFRHPNGQKWGDLRLWKSPGILSRLIHSGRCPAFELAPVTGQGAPVEGVCTMACSAHSLRVLLLLSVWCLGLEHQRHLGACEKCRVAGPAQDLLKQNLYFDTMIHVHIEVQEPFSEQGEY